ncbi:MAG: hypothetical protein M1833_004847 [Piccolia ochrophora]|nr:MAG: hypothetical protein M1833_004847 [Piccolia ochrophora]
MEQKTLKFINDEAASVHGNVRVSSVYTSESGEWKLGGFETLSSIKDDEAIIYSSYPSLVPDFARFAPPEVAQSGSYTMKQHSIVSADAYTFGIFIYEVFNGTFTGREQAGQTKNIPPTMQQSYKRLVNANPKARMSVAHFLEQGNRSGGFFETALIRLTEGVESLGVKSESEREEFLDELDDLSDDFPESFFKMKVLPELLKSLEFGGGGSKVFGVVMKITAKLSDDEFTTHIVPVIVRLFASPDRATRVYLLDNLPLMVDRLPQKVVNDKIFPQLVSGFMDVAPIVREQTVKSILSIITKLSDRVINGELLKYLAKTANDEQPGIRTNTTICLGKIARNLGATTRPKVLTAAFARSLRDPFIHARNAALMALAATCDVFTEEDCATKLMPAICPSLVDKEKLIRDQANKTLDVYAQRVRKYASTLPDSALPPPNSTDSTGASVPRMSTPQNDSTWTGWAISSFTNKLASASGEMQSNTSTNGTVSRPKDSRSTSAPPSADAARPNPPTASASALHRQAIASPPLPSTGASTPNPFQSNSPESDDGADAWAAMDEDSFFDPPTDKPPATPPVAYDDGGEPDFAGWLNAQAHAKAKNPRPKGLAKKPQAAVAGEPKVKPVAARSTTTGSVGLGTGAKKAASTTIAAPLKAKPLVAKKVDTKPKDEGWAEDDGWGDGWE